MNPITCIGDKRLESLDPDEWGNKASGLASIAKLGIPLPPAFVLPVSFCHEFFASGKVLPESYLDAVISGLQFLSEQMGQVFGSSRKPLLVSVRSGAPVSLPGMMDTVLNIGLSPRTIEGLIYSSGNPRFAWDCLRRFIEQYATTICYVPSRFFSELKTRYGEEKGYYDLLQLDFSDLSELCDIYQKVLNDRFKIQIPHDPYDHLKCAVEAVLRSWNAPRAQEYRENTDTSGVLGTAVIIQGMVFGNIGFNSGAGVAFSRNPWNGSRDMVVDFRFNAQGEEIVSGSGLSDNAPVLHQVLPSIHETLLESARLLENHFQDMQDIEFTIENGKLYILQTRSGKRSPYAAARIASDMVREGIIDQKTAYMRVGDIPKERLVFRYVQSNTPPLGTGVPASLGVVSGRVAFTREQAESLYGGSPVILILNRATPNDIPMFNRISGLLTREGVRTSHAAVVARQMEKVCIVGCSDLFIHQEMNSCQIGQTRIDFADTLTLDGSSGRIYRGESQFREDVPFDLLKEIEEWRNLMD